MTRPACNSNEKANPLALLPGFVDDDAFGAKPPFDAKNGWRCRDCLIEVSA